MHYYAVETIPILRQKNDRIAEWARKMAFFAVVQYRIYADISDGRVGQEKVQKYTVVI